MFVPVRDLRGGSLAAAASSAPAPQDSSPQVDDDDDDDDDDGRSHNSDEYHTMKLDLEAGECDLDCPSQKGRQKMRDTELSKKSKFVSFFSPPKLNLQDGLQNSYKSGWQVTRRNCRHPLL